MKRLVKLASYYITLHSFIGKTLEPVEFSARIVSNKIQYSIIVEHQFYNSSFYDGSSFEDAFEFYIDIVIAFKNVQYAEYVRRQKQRFLEKARRLLYEVTESKYREQHTPYFKKPLFLGLSEGC